MVSESGLIRPYCYLRYQNQDEDEDVRKAYELRRNGPSVRSILLECLLVRSEYDCSSIAKKLSLTEATIEIYGTSARDRERLRRIQRRPKPKELRRRMSERLRRRFDLVGPHPGGRRRNWR